MPDDKRIISTQILEDTADAIREKLGTQAGITPAEFAENISQIGTPELQNKTVTPSTSQQTVIADDGYQGLDTVTVEAVTSDIDSNIVAENIKKDVTILGVTGNYEGSGGGGDDIFGVRNLDISIKKIRYIDTTSSTTSMIKYIVPTPNILKIKHAYIITVPNTNGISTKIELVAGTYQLFRTCDNSSTLTYGDVIITETSNGKYISVNGFTSLNQNSLFCWDANRVLPSPYAGYLGYLTIEFDFEDSSVYNNIIYTTSNTVGINFGTVTRTSLSGVSPTTNTDKTVSTSSPINIKLSELTHFNIAIYNINGVSTSILQANFITISNVLRTE